MAAGAGHVQAGASQAGLQAQADCRVGGPPTQPYGERPPEGFLRYATRPVVIGCAELASGRRFELVGYQLARGKRSSLCIDQYDFETRISSGCGSDVVYGGGAIDGTSGEETAGHVPVVAGAVSASVARVVVRSEIGGRLRRHPTALLGIRGRKLLRMIGVRRPFGRYVAEIPAGARAATAEALGARGRTRGLAFLPGFREPVGQVSRPMARAARAADVSSRFPSASRVVGPSSSTSPPRGYRAASAAPPGRHGALR